MSRMTYTPSSSQPIGLASSSSQQQQASFRTSSSSRSGGSAGAGSHQQQQQQSQYGSHHQPSHYHQSPQQQYPYAQPSPYQSYASSRTLPAQGQRSHGQGSATKQQQSLPGAETWVDTLIYTLDAIPPPTTWPSHILDTVVLQPLAFVLSVLTSPRTHRLILRISLLTTVFWSALALAIAAYIAFYNAWVPHLGLRVPVWLQYGDASVAPWADVYFDPPGKFFADDQQYDVTLELTVPLTPANLDLGNFMVSISMFADAAQEPILSSSRPTLLHPSASTLASLSSLLSRNPNPDINPFAALSGGAAPGSSSGGPPITLLSVPLLQRAVLQVGSGSAFSTASKTPAPASNSKTAKGKNSRSPSANHIPGHIGVKNTAQNINRARISVGRSDSERYWMYGGGHGGNGQGRGGNGGADAFVSRGELQTHAVSLRFDAHLTGLRFFMYHYPLLSFLTFTSLFLLCELGAAVFAAGIFAIYSTIANSNIDVRTADESFVVSGKSKTSGRSPIDEKQAFKTEGGIKREEDGDTTPASEGRKPFDDDGEADSLVTSSSALGTFEDDDDEEVETPGLDEELDQLLGTNTAAERAYRTQMAARARSRIERVASGAEYDDSEDTEREDNTATTTPSRRPAGSALSQQQQQQQQQVQAQQQQALVSPSTSSVPLGQGVTSERRVLGRLDEETEEETDQTATTTTTSRRAAVGETRPASAARPVVAASPDLGFGTEDEDEDNEERRAERTRARWEVWRASQEAEAQGATTPSAVPVQAQPVVTPAASSEPPAGGDAVQGESSPSASWESVEAEDEAETEGASEEQVRAARRAAAEAASVQEARRLKRAEDSGADTSADADDEGGALSPSVPVAGPSGTSGVAGPSSSAAAAVSRPAAPADAPTGHADDGASTATEEEGEEGAKTAG